MSEGHFVVLEGIDGAGTTTQTARLERALRAQGTAVHATREPSDGPVGVLVRQMLRGRIVVPDDAHGTRAPSWTTLALLFAADRYDHLDAEVLPALRAGTTVISDRYVHSSVAYQSADARHGRTGEHDADDVAAWVLQLNARVRAPDLTVVLDVDPVVASRRRALRSGRAELYETDAFQLRLAAFYRDLDRYFPGENVVHIDGGADADTVHAQVLGAVAMLRPRT